MTTIALHPAPDWRAVAREQFRATASLGRSEGALFLATALAVLTAMVTAHYRSGLLISFGYNYGASSVSAVVAFLMSAVIWRDEAIERRAYHWTMPLSRRRHTLLKTLAGLAWVLIGIAVYIALIAGAALVSRYPLSELGAAWELIAAFTSAAILYLLGSAAFVGSKRPGHWVLGVSVIYILTWIVASRPTGFVGRFFQRITSGELGMVHVVLGPAAMWWRATLFWAVVASLVYAVAVTRHRDA
jgi:hypothetical protein